jgi:hypothetical protein
MSGSDRGYSISLSARSNNASGTVTPIALAVLRLITSSNLVGLYDRDVGDLDAPKELDDQFGHYF